MESLKDFTKLYSLSKTLKFELCPIGATLSNIKKNGLLEEDQHRADSYKLVKKIIDRYHKAYIEKRLAGFQLQNESNGEEDSLEEFFLFYHLKNADPARKKKLETVSTNLRKKVAEQLTASEEYKRIDKKELIKTDLLSFVTTEEEKLLVKEFNDFTTYFTGFHENRKNMYSAEAKSTAISYRLINENLPRFIDNVDTFAKVAIVPAIREGFASLCANLEEYLSDTNLAEVFSLPYFSKVITQKQIEAYNALVGGKSLENGTKIQGLNEIINLYNQRHSRTERLPKFKPLYKQILSDRDAVSWLPEEFKSDEDMLENIEQCYMNLSESVLGQSTKEKTSLKYLLEHLDIYDLEHVYVSSGLMLTDISQRKFGSWSFIQNAVEWEYALRNPKKKRESDEKYAERRQKYFNSFKSFSIAYLNKCIALIGHDDLSTVGKVEEYFAALGKREDEVNLFDKIDQAYAQVKDLLNTPYPKEKNLAQDGDNVEKIKALLDAIKTLQHFVKPLLGIGDEPGKDERFYGELNALWLYLDAVTPLYNKVRNRMTRKPYSEEKIKLNFQNSTLLDGWDVNKEKDNTSVILRKDGLYYLAIMNKKFNQVFSLKNLPSTGVCYEKMEYKLLPDSYRMFPKVFFSKSRIGEFNPSDDILESYNKGTHKKGNNFNLQECHDLIDFFKSSIEKHEDWKNFNFHFSETASYQDINEFYGEVDQQGYKIAFRPVSETYIDSLVAEGKIYLFKIYNKDFSAYSKGTPNMHTLYWKMLFDEENLKDVVYKLNGAAEVFFRKLSISNERPTHPAGHPIANKNKENDKRESLFAYDLIKDCRYTEDKFQFHVPITMNFKSKGKEDVNLLVNQYLHKEKDVHIIGIDRGERHLLYLTMIDSRGKIIKQFSLNEIINEYKGLTHSTNYHDLLNQREEERDKARKSWKTIAGIKDLKEGYLSQVVHKITQLVVEYNAIIVLEDLNHGFMRGRQKVEKQVYQKFEKMLIDKLNYLVDKKKNATEPGGLLHALQLTGKFESFQKMGKQTGILFYVPAWNTSKIDPATGFVNLFDTHYTNREKAKEFFNKFDWIKYNQEKDWFEFKFDYTHFTGKAEGTKPEWLLCTYGTRIKTFRDPEKMSQWVSEEVILSNEFKNLFKQYNIALSSDLKQAITSQTEAAFFETLLHLFKLTLQMRNSKTGTEVDYLLSPVAKADGNFYDSRTCSDTLPLNADANGAYNIARKGLWIVKQIKQTTDFKRIKLAMTNREWLDFAQKKPYLNDEL